MGAAVRQALMHSVGAVATGSRRAEGGETAGLPRRFHATMRSIELSCELLNPADSPRSGRAGRAITLRRRPIIGYFHFLYVQPAEQHPRQNPRQRPATPSREEEFAMERSGYPPVHLTICSTTCSPPLTIGLGILLV